jgi:uncharacterized protein YlzI (FlbEa/FlbD family)
MAWKQLTRDGTNYFVNLDKICFMQQYPETTHIVFSDKHDSVLSITVDQTADEILIGEDLS